MSLGKTDEAIVAYRRALDLNANNALAHHNLGDALLAKGQLDDAIAAYHKAIDSDPRYANAYINLGLALKTKGQLDDAIAAYRRAIDVNPSYALAHLNLGNALQVKGEMDEAIAELHKAIDLNPRFAEARSNLGYALRAKGELDEAIAELRKAIDLNPRFAPAQLNLGDALLAKGRLDDAITAFRKAIEIDSTGGPGHAGVADALLRKGRFAEAKTSYQQALNLLPGNHPLRPLVSQQLQQCQTLLALEAKLAAVLAGKVQPADHRERLGFVEVCQRQQRHAATATLYAAAFAADAKLADDLSAGHRYNAACAAALAGCGQGQDAAALESKEYARLRRQALAWLRADLEAWGQLLDKEPDKIRPILVQQLRHWLVDTDFAGVSGPQAFALLPQPEREPWQKLWVDVASLLARAQANTTPKSESGAK
jgi:tetratricopeptide (TPR) repeat protein